MSFSLTCISCKVAFGEIELHRDHYKSDWHRYNLKRKVAELPPITKEAFDIRVAVHDAETKVVTPIDSSCDLCHKRFSSENAMANHLQSKKHQEAMLNPKTSKPPIENQTKAQKPKSDQTLSKMAIEENVVGSNEEGDDSDWESCEDEEMEDPFSPNECLFCSLESESMLSNVEHMTQVHSFFVPDIEYVSDLKGLVTYLGHKIGNGYLCLWCDTKGKSFKTALAAQKHMIDKGHCKMLHEGEALLSYADFYDYSESYPDASADNNADDEIIMDQLQSDAFELVLPSGATIGHRSLALYYKQNLKPLVPENRRAISRVMQHYKALGWTGTSGEAAVRKAKDLRYFRKIQSKHALKLGMKKNKLQPHLRPQVVF